MDNYFNLVNDFRSTGKGFEKIYNKIYNSLKYFVFGYIKDEDVVNDIISVTMISAHDNIEKYDNELSEFNTWVFAIAKNNCLNYIKNSKRFVSIDSSLGDDENYTQLKDLIESPPQIDKDKEHSIQKLFSEIFKKIDKNSLSGKILKLRHQKNLSLREIANNLNKDNIKEYNALIKLSEDNKNDLTLSRSYKIESDLFYKNNIINESFIKNNLRKSYKILRESFEKDFIEQLLN